MGVDEGEEQDTVAWECHPSSFSRFDFALPWLELGHHEHTLIEGEARQSIDTAVSICIVSATPDSLYTHTEP